MAGGPWVVGSEKRRQLEIRVTGVEPPVGPRVPASAATLAAHPPPPPPATPPTTAPRSTRRRRSPPAPDPTPAATAAAAAGSPAGPTSPRRATDRSGPC